jgi:tetratricopeptide (TPR) repeat protein
MKKLLLAALAVLSLQAFAQKSMVESAAIYLRNAEMEDAKKSIDAAIENPETKTDAKAWFYYVAILDTIYRNPAYEKLADSDLAEKFFNGCKKCIEFDAKKRYEYYCKDNAILNSAFMCFNKGISAYDKKDYKAAINYYQMVLDVIPYDKNEVLKTNNLSEKNIYLYMAYSAIQLSDNPKAKIYLQKLMDLNYDDHLIYMQMANIYLEETDTTNALKYIDLGRGKFSSNKDLINQELNVYLAMGRQDILLTKLDLALETNPDDFQLFYVRGSVYDNSANDLIKKAKHSRDTATTLRKKAQTEKVLAKKTALTTAAANYQKLASDQLIISKESAAKAEADYKKVVELNPDYIDAYYNLGALTNNKTTEVVEKINAIPVSVTQAEYDKRYNPLKKQKDEILNVALGYFKQALEIAEAKSEDTPVKKNEKFAYMRDILYSMQQVYANLDNEKMAIETKKKRDLYE